MLFSYCEISLIKGNNVRKSKVKQISLAVCLVLMPFSGFAAGLGKINVNSGLGEPLKAEIELLSVTPEELSTLVAAIASEDAYAAQGITRLGIHNNIKVEIAKNTDGSSILKLRSNQPISDPYLDMLVQVDWASGRLQREYTVLLDPPGYKQSIDNVTPMPVKPPSVSMSGNGTSPGNIASSSSIDSSQPNIKKTRKLRRSTNQSAAPQQEPVESGAQKLTTKRGDTLNSVAKELQVEGVSLDQMLVGLYENNKEAFTSGNMNRLKVGQIIKVPSKETLTSVDAQQAKQSVKVHSVNWNAYRNNLAGNVAAAPVILDAEQKQSASGKIAAAEDKAAPVKVGPQDVVKLSAGEKETAKSGKDAGKASDAKIAALQEEAAAREKSLKEAQERTAALEKQIQDMQKLLALKSQAMTDIQKNAEAAVKTPDVKPETKTKTKTEAAVAVKTQNTAKAEASAPTEVKPADSTAAVTPGVEKAAPPAQVQPKPQIKAKPQVPSEPQAEPGLLESLMNAIDLTILGGASAVALLGAGWMFLRNKRRKDLDSFERGILTSGGLRANTVFGNTTGNASTSDTSFLTDFAQSADGSMIDTNDVDPIAEAEVYMAYGRDAQAEEILKDAISKEPKRYELHLKLLEMYAARKDTSAFEAIAGELYTTLGADDPTWAKIAAMGATIEPENPLYDVSNAVAAASIATQKLDVSDFADVEVLAGSHLDFATDDEMATDSQPVIEDANAAVMQSFSAVENDEQDLSFDLGTVDSDSMEVTATETASQESADTTPSVKEDVTDNTLSFNSTVDNALDFDLGDFNLETEAAVEPAALAETDDLPAFDATKSDGFETHTFDLTALNGTADSPSTDFDMDFGLPVEMASSDVEHTSEVVSNAMDDISFDLDFASGTPSLSAAQPSELAATEISFDLPLSDEQAIDDVSLATTPENEFAANEFDLSSISLDLGEAAIEPTIDQPLMQTLDESTQSVAAEPESPDVEIKLDLVAAYIDMDDKEGARELLEEVIKEGGSQQQLRAQQLLASLT